MFLQISSWTSSSLSESGQIDRRSAIRIQRIHFDHSLASYSARNSVSGDLKELRSPLLAHEILILTSELEAGGLFTVLGNVVRQKSSRLGRPIQNHLLDY